MSDINKRSQDEAKLSQTYAQLEQVQADPHLDRLILAQARMASEEKAEGQNKSQTSGLLSLDSSLARAAVVILSAGLLVFMTNHHDEQLNPTVPATHLPEEDRALLPKADLSVSDTSLENKVNEDQPGVNSLEPVLIEEEQSLAAPVAVEQQVLSGRQESPITIQDKATEMISTETTEAAKASAPLNNMISSKPTQAGNEHASRKKAQMKLNLETENPSRLKEKSVTPYSTVSPKQRIKSPMEKSQVEHEPAGSRQSTQNKTSIETSINEIKSLIKNNNINKAKVIYRQLLATYSQDQLHTYFTDQQIALLTIKD